MMFKWVCVAAGLYIENENMCIFDSLPRTKIDEYLGNQLKHLFPKESIHDSSGKLTIRVQKTQKQKRELCGFLAAAFATAICLEEDAEELDFDLSQICPHFLECLKTGEISMFPHRKKRVHKTEHLILKY